MAYLSLGWFYNATMYSIDMYAMTPETLFKFPANCEAIHQAAYTHNLIITIVLCSMESRITKLATGNNSLLYIVYTV